MAKKKQPVVLDRVAVVSLQDRYSTYPSAGLTPEGLVTILREADQGDIYRQAQLFEEMLEKDANLFSLFQRRKLKVSRRSYEILPASDTPKDKQLADDVAAMISRIKGWTGVIEDMLDAVPKALSVMEIDWVIENGRYAVRGLRHVHQKKLRFGRISDQLSDPEELRMVVDPMQLSFFKNILPDADLSSATVDGIPLTIDPAVRNRFVITYCKARSGHPARTSILRSCVYPWMFKSYDTRWWIQFAERQLGIVIGKYDTNQPDQKELLERAVRSIATDSAAVISNTSEISFVESLQKAASFQTYSGLMEWANGEEALAVLGHEAAAKATPGKLGQDDNASDSIQELAEGDAAAVDAAISDDLIRTYIDLNFGPQEAYPYYKTHIEPEEDLLSKAKLVKMVQSTGYPIGQKYIKETFGIPPADPSDPEDTVLQPQPDNASLMAAKDMVIGSGKKKLLTPRNM